MDPFPAALALTPDELTAMRGYCQRVWPKVAGEPWETDKQPTTGDVLSALSYAFSTWVCTNVVDKKVPDEQVPEFMYDKAMFSVMVGREMQRRNDELMEQVSKLTKANAVLEARLKTAPSTPPRKRPRVEPVPPSLVPTPGRS